MPVTCGANLTHPLDRIQGGGKTCGVNARGKDSNKKMILVDAGGFDQGPKVCKGCLASTIYHELLHAAGIGKGSHNPGDEVYDYERKCKNALCN